MSRKLLFALLLVISPLTACSDTGEAIRVEPPFWWTGFKETRLQLMIHGDGISEYEPSVGNPRVSITRVERETPGRLLISEIMILANSVAADFLKANGMPAVFRSQPPPRERLYQGEGGSLFQNWMQRKLLSRFALGARGERHDGLGLDAYVTATSPIRKYYDLITQRQIRAVLGLESPYSEAEITALLQRLEHPMGYVPKLQFSRSRYWLLKHLETRIGEKEEAIVLSNPRR